MSTYIFVGLVVIAFIAVFMLGSGKKTNSYSVYCKAKNLLTNNEKEFFNRILKAVPEYYIFPQVSLGALLQVDTDKTKMAGAHNKFNKKIADYVVVDSNFNVVVIIELDDRTHDPEQDKIRDAITATANYRTIRYESKSKPTVEKIRSDILNKK